jgi:hypothetical protein
MDYDKALRAVLRVREGRGFVVASKLQRWERLVITAGHCLLPDLPPPHTGSCLKERTYKLLGPLDAKPTVWAECVFVDLIADLAVLGAPDSQQLYDKNKQYEELTTAMTPLRIAKAGEDTSAFLLSLDLRWHACRVHNCGGALWITGAKTVGGMSGSPIIDKDGRAIGVVCTGSESENIKDYDGPHTHLMRSLPRWMTPLR